jgi:hypothetical protein
MFFLTNSTYYYLPVAYYLIACVVLKFLVFSWRKFRASSPVIHLTFRWLVPTPSTPDNLHVMRTKTLPTVRSWLVMMNCKLVRLSQPFFHITDRNV